MQKGPKKSPQEKARDKLQALVAKRRAQAQAPAQRPSPPPSPSGPSGVEAELFYAVNQKDAAAVRRLLHVADTLAEKFARAVSEKTPLPDLEARNEAQMTALHCAAMGGDVGILRLLLDAGADMHALSHEGLTVMGLAAINGRKDAVEFLLSRGYNLNDSRYPAHANPLCHALFHGRRDIALLMLERGADPVANGGPNHGHALAVAAGMGAHDILDVIFKKGVSPDALADKTGMTALVSAISHNRIDTVKYLLERGADPNFPGGGGRAPIGYAVHMGSAELTKLLLEYGADPYLLFDLRTRNAFDLACSLQSGKKTLPVLERHRELRQAFLDRRAQAEAKAKEEQEQRLRDMADEATKGSRTQLARKKPITFDGP